MQYHELRVFVPEVLVRRRHGDERIMTGLDAVEFAHDALAPAMHAIDDTAPVIVLWEGIRPAAASGAL